ncbi:MAG: hypothetical protein WBH47_02310, partial [Streptosporangiaceae bacterium]
MAENASRATTTETTALAGALLEAFAGFVARLRWLGLDLSLTELTDALRAIRDADLLDREQLRRLLRITMVKRSADIPTFETAFELFFPAALATHPGHDADLMVPANGAGLAGATASADLLSRLVDALRGDPDTGMQALAADAVAAFAGLESGQLAGSQRYYQYRVLRQLDLSTLLLRAMRAENQPETTALDRRLTGIEQRGRLEDLRRQIAAELRWRLADLGGIESALEQARQSVTDVDFLQAGPAELAAMQASVRPLARRLAAAARRRRRTHTS